MEEEEDIKNFQLKEDKSFVSFFKGLEKAPDIIRFFDRKGYYSVHGENAIYLSQTHFNTSRALKYMGSEASGLPYVCIREGIEFESIVDNLLRKQQQRVEVWVMKAGRTSNFELSKKGSPGNLQDFEDILFVNNDLRDSTIIMAAKLGIENGTKVVGVAFADATLRRLGVSQFTDNEQFANFESFILQVGAKECLMTEEKSYDFKKMSGVPGRCNIPLVLRPRGDFDAKHVEQDITRLLGTVQHNLPELEQKFALQALNCVMSYLELLADDSNYEKFKLEKFDLNDYMRLDSSAFRALNVLPNMTTGTNMSLFSLLNQCSTSMGSRRLMQWIKQPLLNFDTLQRRLNFVEVFYMDAVVREELRGTRLLRRMPDCDRLAKAITSRRASLEHCVSLYSCVNRLPDICTSLEAHNSEHNPLLQEEFITPLRDIISDFSQFCQLIENTIDLSQADERHEYIIRPSFSSKLQQLHDDKEQALSLMEQTRQDVAARLGLDENKVKLDNNSQFGYFLRVTRANEGLIRGKSEYLCLDIKKDGVRFRTQKLAKLSEKYTQLVETYTETQSQLVTKVIDIVGMLTTCLRTVNRVWPAYASYIPRLEDLSSLLATLDVYVNFAHVSATAGISYVRPTILPLNSGEQGCIDLKDSRHPCVEAQDTVSFIANDVHLSRSNEKGKARFHIITGPNMGGKSTYIRQVGVIVLMAQIGCFVPCTSAIISVTDSILARVGAGDSQLRGVSTFMAEMLETATILRSATNNSLVIIDELGRGTSTYDGFGLAWAISKYICTHSNAFCLFATHFHELTTLADHIPHVANLHVAAETTNNSLSLLYKVKPGPCDQSFGIHVARLAQFPESIVGMATAKAIELEDFEAGSNITGADPKLGDTNANNLLQKFIELPLENSNPPDVLKKVQSVVLEAKRQRIA